MNDDVDTEILLVSLASLLEPNVPDASTLLNTLVECNGNVEAAAERLSAEPSTSTPTSSTESSKKRKHNVIDLDDWLQPALSKSKIEPRKKPVSEIKTTGAEDAKPFKLLSSSKPHSTGATRIKPVDLMSVLKAPPPEKPGVPRYPPLTLTNPEMVAKNTPCTLHYNILPPELACELFYTMLDAAQDWSRNKWWLFDRVVESPHRTSFFARVDRPSVSEKDMQEEAQFWYNGRRTASPQPFPEEMEAGCRYIEERVNEEMRKRVRFPLEWAGPPEPDGMIWHANVAAANCYEGTKEGVGPHSDQLTNLGPYPTIASLSLGTTRLFRLREVIPSSEKDKRHARTYNIPLPHNSLIIMHASTQERFKHSIPQVPTLDIFRPPFPRRPTPGAKSKEDVSSSGEIPTSNCRINMTFRFYRPDFAASTVPKCRCGVPCVLRPDMKGRVDRQTKVHGCTPPSDGNGDAVSGSKVDGSKGKEEQDEYGIKYWWTCYAGAQNDGKGCGMWKVMDVKAEGRGPFVGDVL